MKQVIVNPLPSPLQLINIIPEVTVDPTSPNAQDAWVLRSGTQVGGGDPIGLLLALTNPGSTAGITYQFSYYTTEGNIKRTSLT
jgi:hypothetical protein